MSTDRTKNKQVNRDRTLTESKSSAEVKAPARMNFLAETEISDETLEAVAGGVDIKLDRESHIG